eukprot:1145809-Pelagomonas_calceolata.AAC.3
MFEKLQPGLPARAACKVTMGFDLQPSSLAARPTELCLPPKKEISTLAVRPRALRKEPPIGSHR